MRVQFSPFTLDFDTRLLTRDYSDIHLSPKAFELLAALVLARPKVLSKAELQRHLWPDTFVAEANLSNLVAEIRRALGDNGPAPKWIRTAHRVGYAFCGNASVSVGTTDTGFGESNYWVEWGDSHLPLAIGEHVIGRDPDADIRLDASTVSRRHAKLVVTREGATLEDFGSKNGTRRDGERVVSPVRLVDGDAIYIGSLLITFHVRPSVGSTETQRP